MPRVYTATFQVRHYECDAHGHLNNANYVRYMEEAAFEATADAGYPQERYLALGCLWLARETEIEFLRPLRYRDIVQVTTWVEDFRRVRSRRRYDFHRPGEAEPVARAVTDWVFLEAATGRPATVPPELIAAFWPDGTPPPAAPRPRFPPPPPPPPGVFTLRKRVEWRDIDTAGHMNNAAYLNHIDDCGMQVARAYGWPLARSQAEGFAAVARQTRIEYRTPALLDDELDIATWVSGKRATATRYYTITRVQDGELLAQARTLWVWVNIHTGRPIRIPPHFAADFRPNMALEPDDASA